MEALHYDNDRAGLLIIETADFFKFCGKQLDVPIKKKRRLRIADRVYVLEHGRTVREGRPNELAGDEYIRQVYLGV
jgi:ABC-type cobalamin transport system ATPase subunit